MARPELVERRPTWPATFRLEPLDDDDVDQLVPDHIPGELRHKIARAAGGNPLFIAEMVAMAGEVGDKVVVPPSLRALLAAAWISSVRPNGASWNAVRSKVRSFTAARFKR